MLNIRSKTALLFGKITAQILKIKKQSASSAPGYYALKIDPDLTAKLQKQLEYSLVITGTNGKTTTAALMAEILQKNKFHVYHNRAGSNLLRGIASTLIKKADFTGQIKSGIGLWEADEAALPEIITALQPKIIILTNLFRDQLDRYAELDSLFDKWEKALKKISPQTYLIINADDPELVFLSRKINCRLIYFGINKKQAGQKQPDQAADSIFCPNCQARLIYKAVYVSHLGDYYCSQCGFKRPKLDFQAEMIKLFKTNSCFNIVGKKENQNNKANIRIKINLNGLYNIYNFLAAFSAARIINLKTDNIAKALKTFQPVFGRLEQIKSKDQCLTLMLVKNPTGFNEVLKTIKIMAGKEKISLLIVLNDLIADGRDTSWIWDIDFKILKKINVNKIFVTGRRAGEMGLRLKYELINTALFENLSVAINKLLKQKEKQLFILPNYTAMLETRKILKKINLIK